MEVNDTLRKYREEAFKIIQTPRYWYRQHYNLTENDPRYMDATNEEIILDFICHNLWIKYESLAKDGAQNITLDDLLIEEKFEEAMNAPPDEEQEVLIDIRG